MKKTKLFGSRLIDMVKIPRTPNIIMLGKNDDINEAIIEEGDLLDANSIKMAISAIPNAPIDFDVQEITDEDIDKIIQLDSGDINDPFVTKKYVDNILKADGVVIGQDAQTPDYDYGVVCIGVDAKTTASHSVAIGNASISGEQLVAQSIAIGSGASYGGAHSSEGLNVAIGYGVDVNGCGSTLVGIGLRVNNNYHTMIGCCPAFPYNYKYTDKFTLAIGETGGKYLPTPQVRKTGMRINKDDQLYIINVGGYKGDGTLSDSSIKSLLLVITGLLSDINNKASKNNASLSGDTVLNTVRIDGGIIKTPNLKYLYTNNATLNKKSTFFSTNGELTNIGNYMMPPIKMYSNNLGEYYPAWGYTNMIENIISDENTTGDIRIFVSDHNDHNPAFDFEYELYPIDTSIIMFNTGDNIDNITDIIFTSPDTDTVIKYANNISVLPNAHYVINIHRDLYGYYVDSKVYTLPVT